MNIQGKNNLNSGYFSLEEQPEVVVNLIKFIENSPKIYNIFFFNSSYLGIRVLI